MPAEASISPHGRLLLHADDPPDALARRLIPPFERSTAHGLLHLASVELQTAMPPSLAFARDFGRSYLTRLAHLPNLEPGVAPPPIEAPSREGLAMVALGAPPMRGLEYLTAGFLAQWFAELDALVREQLAEHGNDVGRFLSTINPLWRLVGRVTFHLAENKRDPGRPFAFLATYSSKLSALGKVQHLPLGRALQEYAGAKNRDGLLALLVPVQRAAERSTLVKELADTNRIYQPQAWTARDAYRFLQDVPAFEEAGLIVRVPDWWKPKSPPRPVVSVKVGDRARSKLGVEALLDFSVNVSLDGEPLTEAEIQSLVASPDNLVLLKGRWVEVDREKLKQALEHWKSVESEVKQGGLTFFEGMRLLSGATLPGDATATPEAIRRWTGLEPSDSLRQTLDRLRDPDAAPPPPTLQGELRPYQQVGYSWLKFMSNLGLGACLADDMGLGKTVQVITLLLAIKEHAAPDQPPSLLVVPASLIANWKAEIARFGPSLVANVVHPSERSDAPNPDVVITTYGMLTRSDALRSRSWRLAILDEAQAIKNSGTRQTKAVKELKSHARIAMTGTPVENRLSDLWSLFDFLNPGLLGGPKAFGQLVKRLDSDTAAGYAPLRNLVKPYILRRLKTDKRIISDLPDKTEVNAFCGLSKRQAALYEQTVRDLAKAVESADGIRRKGVVLAALMRFKQICNHPAQLTSEGSYDPADSGKFQRLAEICPELAERQEKALVFTQFREITGPIERFLAGIFGRAGLVLHGGTPVKQRRELVDAFQRDDGPPFFVLSLKAGGTGLNLTAASHVIHFDRWWNPAVENQATDRAFRIGQRRNVLVHKFVCRGTVEERIDAVIAEKQSLSRDLLDQPGETLLTEMPTDQLLRFVSLDLAKALET